jgi:hypothetical protein
LRPAIIYEKAGKASEETGEQGYEDIVRRIGGGKTKPKEKIRNKAKQEAE